MPRTAKPARASHANPALRASPSPPSLIDACVSTASPCAGVSLDNGPRHQTGTPPPGPRPRLVPSSGLSTANAALDSLPEPEPPAAPVPGRLFALAAAGCLLDA